MKEAVKILGKKFWSEDEKSGKVTWEQKAHSAVQEGEGGPCELLLLAQVVDLNISKCDIVKHNKYIFTNTQI